MAQFDVYENPDTNSKTSVPFLLDVQAELLSQLNTRVVVPLVPVSALAHPLPLLNPQLQIEDTSVVMATAELSGIHISLLGAKVGNLKDSRT